MHQTASDSAVATTLTVYDQRVMQAREIGVNLRDQKELLNRYILQKQKANDYHGIADAAMDIREIDAKLDVLKELGLL